MYLLTLLRDLDYIIQYFYIGKLPLVVECLYCMYVLYYSSREKTCILWPNFS